MSGISRRQALTAGVVSGVAVLAVAAPSAGQDKEADAERVKAEFAALQGTWRCLRWEQEGMVMPEEARRTVSVVVKGETYKSTVDGVNFKQGTLTLNPSATPSQADAPFDGGLNRSIYVRSGDYMILCVGGERRPAGFVCGGQEGGDSLYVFRIER
jgi:uncharacterized protein (TIGR03067 family)